MFVKSDVVEALKRRSHLDLNDITASQEKASACTDGGTECVNVSWSCYPLCTATANNNTYLYASIWRFVISSCLIFPQNWPTRGFSDTDWKWDKSEPTTEVISSWVFRKQQCLLNNLRWLWNCFVWLFQEIYLHHWRSKTHCLTKGCGWWTKRMVGQCHPFRLSTMGPRGWRYSPRSPSPRMGPQLLAPGEGHCSPRFPSPFESSLVWPICRDQLATLGYVALDNILGQVWTTNSSTTIVSPQQFLYLFLIIFF